MSLRTVLLSGVLAGGLILTLVPRVAADPPPWAPAWGHSRHSDGDSGSHYYWNDRNYRGNDPQYVKLVDRINHDRAKIAEIGPTGRNRKALQWYRDDLRNAERDMHNYRDYRTSRDFDSSGRYYDSRYDNGAEASFDWSNLLGALLNQSR